MFDGKAIKDAIDSPVAAFSPAAALSALPLYSSRAIVPLFSGCSLSLAVFLGITFQSSFLVEPGAHDMHDS